MLLSNVLSRQIRVGSLRIAYSDGRMETYGDGSGPSVALKLTPKAERDLLRDPHLAVGETYMDGDLAFIEGEFWDLMEIAGRNNLSADPSRSFVLRSLRAVQRFWNQRNGRSAAKHNVRHHYDLSLDLFQRFLDEDLQYSCAYFSQPDMSLDAAQAAKKAHLGAKLDLSPGQTVLDIGCGWGGLAIELAGRHGVQVHGVTLSEEQLSTATARAQASGLASRAQFSLMDYRDVGERFDRIVSVGMLEHIGRPNLGEYFGHIRRLLEDDGIAVVHAIGNAHRPCHPQPFLQKYVFPGGYIPSLSEIVTAIENERLWINDIEILRLHYAETLKQWRARFMERREDIVAMYDERFARMWEAYLCVSELAFRYLNFMVFQIQVTKRADVLPLTRDYIYQPARKTLVHAVGRG